MRGGAYIPKLFIWGFPLGAGCLFSENTHTPPRKDFFGLIHSPWLASPWKLQYLAFEPTRLPPLKFSNTLGWLCIFLGTGTQCELKERIVLCIFITFKFVYSVLHVKVYIYKLQEMWSGHVLNTVCFWFNWQCHYLISFTLQTLTLSVLDNANILIMHMVGIVAMNGLIIKILYFLTFLR